MVVRKGGGWWMARLARRTTRRPGWRCRAPGEWPAAAGSTPARRPWTPRKNWPITMMAIDQCSSRDVKVNLGGAVAGASVVMLHFRDVDFAGGLGFSGAAFERPGVDRRPRAGERIVRRAETVRQDHRVEVDVASVAGSFGEHRVDGDGSGVDGAPLRGPRQRGVVGRVAWLGDREQQPPAHRSVCDPRDERVEEAVVTATGACGLGRRIDGYRGPPDRNGGTAPIGGDEGVEAVEGAVGEAGTRRRGLEYLHRGRRLGMLRQERGHRLRIGFPRGRVWIGCQDAVVEALRCAVGEHRDVDHGGPPLLAIGHVEQEPQAADGRGLVGDVRNAPRHREAGDDRHGPGAEDRGLRHLGTRRATR